MAVCSVKEIEISLLIRIPFLLHDTIVQGIIIKLLLSYGNQACCFDSFCCEVIIVSFCCILSPGDLSVLRSQIIRALIVGKPASYQIARAIQIISGIIIVNPASLHLPVTIESCLSIMGNKSLWNDQGTVVLVLIVHIHTAAKPIHFSIAGILPEADIIIVITVTAVLCYPFVPSADRKLGGKHIFIGIHHWMITCSIDRSTERIDNINELLIRQILMAFILNIKNNRIVYCIVTDPLQYKIRFILCSLRCRCIGINIYTCLKACRSCPLYIGVKVRIHATVSASSLDKCKLHATGCYL